MADDSNQKPIARRRRRELRMCGEFQHGKCVHCNQPATDSHICDMKTTKPGDPEDSGTGE